MYRYAPCHALSPTRLAAAAVLLLLAVTAAPVCGEETAALDIIRNPSAYTNRYLTVRGSMMNVRPATTGGIAASTAVVFNLVDGSGHPHSAQSGPTGLPDWVDGDGRRAFRADESARLAGLCQPAPRHPGDLPLRHQRAVHGPRRAWLRCTSSLRGVIRPPMSAAPPTASPCLGPFSLAACADTTDHPLLSHPARICWPGRTEAGNNNTSWSRNIP